MKKAFFIISLLLLPATIAFSDTAFADTAITKDRQTELLYFLKHDCGSCHGMTLKGGLGPALLPESLTGKPEDFLATTIIEGREGTAMPPWKPMLNYNEALWLSRQLKNGTALQTRLADTSGTGKSGEDK